MATHFSILAGKFHGQGSLVGYSPLVHKESDMTERLSMQSQQCSSSPMMHGLGGTKRKGFCLHGLKSWENKTGYTVCIYQILSGQFNTWSPNSWTSLHWVGVIYVLPLQSAWANDCFNQLNRAESMCGFPHRDIKDQPADRDIGCLTPLRPPRCEEAQGYMRKPRAGAAVNRPFLWVTPAQSPNVRWRCFQVRLAPSCCVIFCLQGSPAMVLDSMEQRQTIPTLPCLNSHQTKSGVIFF